MEVIKTINLTKTYEEKENLVYACKDINLTIRQGEFAVITGASGSGKSTLLHLIGGKVINFSKNITEYIKSDLLHSAYKKEYCMFKGVLYYFKMCWRLEKGFPVALICYELLNTARTVMLVILPKYIIDALFVTHNKEQAVRFLAVYVSFLFCVNFLTAVCLRFAMIRRNLSFQRFQSELGKKLMNVDFERIETPAFLDLKQKAERFVYSDGYGFGVILLEAIGLVGKVIAVISISAIIFTLSPYLILAVILIVILNACVLDNSRIVQDGSPADLIKEEGKYRELYNLQAKFYT